MYFLSDIDQKLLINKLMPLARKTGVSEDLRGWHWHKEPMKPYYEDVKLPMYLVCSMYCPTHRDVFLNKVQGKKGDVNFYVSMGMTLHEVVGQLMTMFVEDKIQEFEDWWKDNVHHISYKDKSEEGVERLKNYSEIIWEHTLTNCKSEFSNKSAHQPYATRRDVMATAVPFLVEHRISGELLGLSGLLGVDCYDYLRSIVFDFKTMKNFDNLEDWHKLYPTGYALVLESIYEIPVDIGGIVFITFKNEKLVVKKELFFINDDLRSWWLEERDKKLEIVAQKKDPGIPNKCPEDCIYWKECH